MHRLVQQAALQRMSSKTRSLTFELLVEILSQLFPKQKLGMAMDRLWRDCELFLPQVLVVATHYKLQDVSTKVLHEFVELVHNATW